LHTSKYSDTVRYAMAATLQTFLFVDLVGFTALAASEGDERAADVAIELDERVCALLPEHGGERVKAIGDALMIRCEDAAAGVRLALEIVRALDAVAGFPPVRVGVHTGTAVCRGGDWYGSGVNVAARLCAAAAGGEVLVSEESVRAAGRLRRVRLGERRLHWLKNVIEPVPTRSATLRPGCDRGLPRLLDVRRALAPRVPGAAA
jgi:adenylate cyclase